MRSYRTIFTYLICILCIISLSVSSCSGVKLDPQSEENCTVVLKCVGTESEIGTVEDNVNVAMSRSVNEVHYLYKADNRTEYTVGIGTYNAIAFKTSDDGYDMQCISDFCNNNDVSLNNIKISLPKLTEEDIHEKFSTEEIGEIVDLSPSFPIVDNAQPFYYAHQKKMLSPVTTVVKRVEKGEVEEESGIEEGGTEEGEIEEAVETKTEEVIVEEVRTCADTIAFNIKDLTMHIKVNLSIAVAEGVNINGIIGNITGVPSFFYFLSGDVDRSDICKTYFRLEKSEDNVYSGEINTLGLFLPDKADYISGNGILYTYIGASVGDKSRVFHIACNLKKYFGKKGLMIPLSQDGRYTAEKKDIVINIEEDITIGEDNVLIGDGSSAKWIKGENLSADDQNPRTPL